MQGRTPSEGESLTQMELAAVELLADGWTDGEIAQRIFVSDRTAKNYIQRARLKLNASNRAHLVTRAFRAGLLKVPDYHEQSIVGLLERVAAQVGYTLVKKDEAV
jgi:DNA-binding NarL/FixJ family response regulator